VYNIPTASYNLSELDTSMGRVNPWAELKEKKWLIDLML